jgi:hypothetical protein
MQNARPIYGPQGTTHLEFGDLVLRNVFINYGMSIYFILRIFIVTAGVEHSKECTVLIPDSSEFLGSRDFSRFSEAASAEENREKSRESRNSRESGISNWSSPIGGVFYPRQQRGVQEPN